MQIILSTFWNVYNFPIKLETYRLIVFDFLRFEIMELIIYVDLNMYVKTIDLYQHKIQTEITYNTSILVGILEIVK